jgi:hypothetical protein
MQAGGDAELSEQKFRYVIHDGQLNRVLTLADDGEAKIGLC